MPRKSLNLDPLRLFLMQSGIRLLFNTCDKTILNLKISGGNVAWGGGGGPSFPPYKTSGVLFLFLENPQTFMMAG